VIAVSRDDPGMRHLAAAIVDSAFKDLRTGTALDTFKAFEWLTSSAAEPCYAWAGVAPQQVAEVAIATLALRFGEPRAVEEPHWLLPHFLTGLEVQRAMLLDRSNKRGLKKLTIQIDRLQELITAKCDRGLLPVEHKGREMKCL